MQSLRRARRKIQTCRFFLIPGLLTPELFVTISAALWRGHSSVRLSQVLKECPPEKGLGEIMAYLEMASRSRNARIEEKDEQLVEYTVNDVKKGLLVPEVVFLNEKV